MKKLLFSLLVSVSLAVGFTVSARAQFAPTPVLYPFNGVQNVYVDSNFHSVPYVLAFSNTGIPTVVFDPSASAVDQSNAFRHAQKSTAGSLANGAVLATVVLPNVVKNNVNQIEVRTAVPFSVTSSTTLQTIPWTVPVYVQSNGHYRFRAVLYLNTGSGGSKFDVGGTCNTSNFVASYLAYASTTILYGGTATSFLSGPSGSSTAAKVLIIDGEMDVTNGGTFVVQFAQNGSDTTPSTVLAGSTLTLVQIP